MHIYLKEKYRNSNFCTIAWSSHFVGGGDERMADDSNALDTINEFSCFR